MKIQASLQKDVYKEFHVHAYHPEVTKVYSNYTNRSNKLSNIEGNKGVVFFGLRYAILKYLVQDWEDFFNKDKSTVIHEHSKILSKMLGYHIDTSYLKKLHDLQYLPLEIKALPEGTIVPYQVPCFTIVNTLDGFQWLTNMIETAISSYVWPMSTNATTSKAYYDTFVKYAKETGADQDLIRFQGHDFSFRGMFGVEAAAMSGASHLSSGFIGTDTIPTVCLINEYYSGNLCDELIGCSVNATEHSVTCSWGKGKEIDYFKYLMNEVSPHGILSIVSDTWDFWEVVGNYLPKLKEDILKRNGKVVIRPDSGNPVDILCGNENCSSSNEQKGLIECLWDIFGGTINDKGFKELNSKIGAIYGDSITLERQKQILEKLKNKGFASTNVVLGIGSYTYQYVTRDTHGTAIKATAVMKNGKWEAIYKEPKTDNSKKSLRGLLKVYKDDKGNLKVKDNCTADEEKEGILQTVFLNGSMNYTNFDHIRDLVKSQNLFTFK